MKHPFVAAVSVLAAGVVLFAAIQGVLLWVYYSQRRRAMGPGQAGPGQPPAAGPYGPWTPPPGHPAGCRCDSCTGGS